MDIEVNKKNFWIVLFIYLSIFINSYVLFKEPVEFYIGYLIFIVLLPVFVSRYGLSRSLFFIFLTLLVTGVSYIFSGDNTSQQFLKIFIGLSLSYFFYHYVVQAFDYNVDQLFRWYLKGAYFAAVIGIIQFVSYMVGFTPGYNYSWIFNKWGVGYGGNFGIRVNSVFGEPTYLGAVLSAAFFVSCCGGLPAFFLGSRADRCVHQSAVPGGELRLCTVHVRVYPVGHSAV
jgi:hypothetical protein